MQKVLQLINRIKQKVKNILAPNKKMEQKGNQDILQPHQIQVTSYNILAELYTDQWYFPYCENNYLIFDYRKLKIVEEVSNLNSDIICMQEVDNFEKFYKTEFENLGYECHYVSKIFRQEGILILFKKDKFLKLSEKILKFDDMTPPKINKNNHYQRNNNAQILCLKHIYTGQNVVVANTHTFWNPNNEEVKLLQTSFVLEDLSQTYKQDEIIFFCGDFNSMPQSNVVAFVNEKSEPNINRIEANFQKQVLMNDMNFIYSQYSKSIKYTLKSAYENYQGSGQHPEFSNYTQKFRGNLDYIFYNHETKKCELVGVRDMPIDEVKKEVGLPSQNFPSDHLPITAVFNLQKVINNEDTNSENCQQSQNIVLNSQEQVEKKLSELKITQQE